MEIDHDARQVFTEIIRVLPTPPDISLLRPSEEAVAARITSPIVTTYIDTEKIAFERFSCYSKGERKLIYKGVVRVQEK